MVAAAAASSKVPLLMLAEKEENGEIREFFDLSSGITHSIVYSMGELLVIHRDGPISDEGKDTDQYGAKTFHVYKINDCNYEEIKDLGDRALFVGKSATLAMAIEDDQGSGCKRNHIYFTDDCVDSYFNLEQGGGKDMGVYSMVDGTIVPHYTGQSYHKVTPPLWV